jgi:hypothetical protein
MQTSVKFVTGMYWNGVKEWYARMQNTEIYKNGKKGRKSSRYLRSFFAVIDMGGH